MTTNGFSSQRRSIPIINICKVNIFLVLLYVNNFLFQNGEKIREKTEYSSKSYNYFSISFSMKPFIIDLTFLIFYGCPMFFSIVKAIETRLRCLYSLTTPFYNVVFTISILNNLFVITF